MKRTPLVRKTAFNRAYIWEQKQRKPLVRRTKLRVEGHSETAELKRDIQAVARDIVILRDGGCVFRVLPGHVCSGYRQDGQLILQADHVISRSNSATYADTRLIVCVCKGIHAWKSLGGNARKNQYDALLKTILTPERVKLWEACEADSWRAHRTSAYDWKLALVALKAELASLQKCGGTIRA